MDESLPYRVDSGGIGCYFNFLLGLLLVAGACVLAIGGVVFLYRLVFG